MAAVVKQEPPTAMVRARTPKVDATVLFNLLWATPITVEGQHPIHCVLEASVLTTQCRVRRPVKTKPRACISLIFSDVYVHPGATPQ